MELVEDRWLAERLGRPAFTVREADDLEVPLPEDLAPGFYQARVPARRIDAVRTLLERGFYVTSTGVTLGRTPGAQPGAPRVEVRDADPERDAALLDIAESAFRTTRFHLDPQIGDETANRIKRDWVQSCLGGTRGDGLLVAVMDRTPVGFLATIGGAADGVRLRVIDLIAVAPAHQRSGAGVALVNRMLADAEGRCDEVRVGTQAANPAAIRFYERLGFETVAMAYDLHLHL